MWITQRLRGSVHEKYLRNQTIGCHCLRIHSLAQGVLLAFLVEG